MSGHLREWRRDTEPGNIQPMILRMYCTRCMQVSKKLLITFCIVRSTHTRPIPINALACSDNTPNSLDFWQMFNLMLNIFFNVKILVGEIEGAQKTLPSKVLFFC